MQSKYYTHSPIKEILPNIFFVTGANQYEDDTGMQQHSRNMIIVRQGNKLHLINTVRF